MTPRKIKGFFSLKPLLIPAAPSLQNHLPSPPILPYFKIKFRSCILHVVLTTQEKSEFSLFYSLKDLIGPMACHCNAFSKDVKQENISTVVESWSHPRENKGGLNMLSHYGTIRIHLHSQNELWMLFFAPAPPPLFFGKIGAPQGLISSLLPFRTRWEALADVTIAYDFPLRYFY